MDGEVSELRDDESTKAEVHLKVSERWWGEEWVVDKVGDEGGEPPVVGAVLKRFEISRNRKLEQLP